MLGGAPLNLATALLPRDNPTDLGPKTYIAYGREAERSDPHNNEGDSVTKLHLDMTDAVNIMLHSQYLPGHGPGPARCGDAAPELPGWGAAGAVWDITRREDVPKLCAWLRANKAAFVHQGERLAGYLGGGQDAELPVLIQRFMLAQRHREALKEEAGVEAWTFEQMPMEAVFIPGGCPHQVRNLRPCTKVAVDFLTPASLGQVALMRERLRQADLANGRPCQLGAAEDGEDGSAPHNRVFSEKLQSHLMVIRGSTRAWRALRGEPWPPEGEAAAAAAPAAGGGAKKRARGGGADGARRRSGGGKGRRAKASSSSEEEEQKEGEGEGSGGGEEENIQPPQAKRPQKQQQRPRSGGGSAPGSPLRKQARGGEFGGGAGEGAGEARGARPRRSAAPHSYKVDGSDSGDE
ncbi:MAG: hypothetical protein J3K34DRAFT_418391 [Monoraphidium minutum]|nr:MAG: hypothetical protein J3K34DRAFT_418391 [Monoraphidium minutum]